MPTAARAIRVLEERVNVDAALAEVPVFLADESAGPADRGLWLVALDGLPPALHLTQQATLDALGLDDRISTGRLDAIGRPDGDPLLGTCGQLADRVHDWWDGRPPPLVYRTRTTPAEGRSIAFGPPARFTVRSARPLREATALHASLVLHAGFTVPEARLDGS